MSKLLEKLAELANSLDKQDAEKIADEVDGIMKNVALLEEQMVKVSFIRRRGNKWCVISKKGKSLGCYDSRKKALKRLRAIEYFKHNK